MRKNEYENLKQFYDEFCGKPNPNGDTSIGVEFIYNKIEETEPVSAYDSFMTVEHLESMLSEPEKERYKRMHSFLFKIVPLKDEFIDKLKVHVEAFYKEDSKEN